MANNEIWLYHFTHIENIANIIQHGLCCDSSLSSCAYINSGNMNIKTRRKSKDVPFGGVVADYVPFYFATRSPMLYTQHVNRKVIQSDIAYVATTVDRIFTKKYTWCFSNMNAAKLSAQFFNSKEEIIRQIDWDLMSSQYWRNTHDAPDRMERRMAEFLVLGSVAWEDIVTICVYDDNAKMALIKRNQNDQKCRNAVIAPDNYF